MKGWFEWKKENENENEDGKRESQKTEFKKKHI